VFIFYFVSVVASLCIEHRKYIVVPKMGKGCIFMLSHAIYTSDVPLCLRLSLCLSCLMICLTVMWVLALHSLQESTQLVFISNFENYPKQLKKSPTKIFTIHEVQTKQKLQRSTSVSA